MPGYFDSHKACFINCLPLVLILPASIAQADEAVPSSKVEKKPLMASTVVTSADGSTSTKARKEEILQVSQPGKGKEPTTATTPGLTFEARRSEASSSVRMDPDVLLSGSSSPDESSQGVSAAPSQFQTARPQPGLSTWGSTGTETTKSRPVKIRSQPSPLTWLESDSGAPLFQELQPVSPPAAISQVEPTAPARDPELGVVQVKPGSSAEDSELGIIQVQPPSQQLDPELGIIELRNPLSDPELGIIQVNPAQPLPARRPFIYVSAYVTASSSDNVFLTVDPVQGRVGDNFVRPGINIVAFPMIGDRTNLLASVEANFLRYQEQSSSSYDELRVRGGIRHSFSDRVYGQVSVTNQRLFNEGLTDLCFNSNAVELLIGRHDLLTPQLILDTFYQGQLAFTDPDEFSNVLNSAGATLAYRFHPQWETGISYRFTVVDYTQQARYESYQRLIGQLRYSLTPSTRITLFGGVSTGRSSEANISFDDTFLGLSFDTTLEIF